MNQDKQLPFTQSMLENALADLVMKEFDIIGKAHKVLGKIQAAELKIKEAERKTGC